MKATLEFDLPEEQTKFELHCKSGKLYSNLWDLTDLIRRWRKHGHPFKNADELLNELWEEVIDHSLL